MTARPHARRRAISAALRAQGRRPLRRRARRRCSLDPGGGLLRPDPLEAGAAHGPCIARLARPAPRPGALPARTPHGNRERRRGEDRPRSRSAGPDAVERRRGIGQPLAPLPGRNRHPPAIAVIRRTFPALRCKATPPAAKDLARRIRPPDDGGGGQSHDSTVCLDGRPCARGGAGPGADGGSAVGGCGLAVAAADRPDGRRPARWTRLPDTAHPRRTRVAVGTGDDRATCRARRVERQSRRGLRERRGRYRRR